MLGDPRCITLASEVSASRCLQSPYQLAWSKDSGFGTYINKQVKVWVAGWPPHSTCLNTVHTEYCRYIAIYELQAGKQGTDDRRASGNGGLLGLPSVALGHRCPLWMQAVRERLLGGTTFCMLLQTCRCDELRPQPGVAWTCWFTPHRCIGTRKSTKHLDTNTKTDPSAKYGLPHLAGVVAKVWWWLALIRLMFSYVATIYAELNKAEV